jgi:hypothetical protein
MLAGLCPLAQTKEPVGEFLAVVRENGADADRADALQVAQETSCIGRRLAVVYSESCGSRI